MLFYKSVEALSRDLHAQLKLDATNDLSFSANSYWVPVAGVEFFRAADHFPVVFLKENEDFIPIALLGLEESQNLFVTEDSSWLEGAYIPAFIRRYPFVLAGSSQNDEQLTVCLDRDYSGFNETKGEALFNEKGEPTEFLNNVMSFLSNYNADMTRTQEFATILKEKNLLESKTVTITSNNDEKFDVQNVYILNEEAFSKLDGETLVLLNQKGMLGWVFAHLASLNNFPALFDLFRKKKSIQDKAVKSVKSKK